VAGCCECSDEPSGSCATELVNCFYCFWKLLSFKTGVVKQSKIFSHTGDISGPYTRFYLLI
jgi:hypothetical protein